MVVSNFASKLGHYKLSSPFTGLTSNNGEQAFDKKASLSFEKAARVDCINGKRPRSFNHGALACQTTSPFNRKIGWLICMAIFLISLQKTSQLIVEW